MPENRYLDRLLAACKTAVAQWENALRFFQHADRKTLTTPTLLRVSLSFLRNGGIYGPPAVHLSYTYASLRPLAMDTLGLMLFQHGRPFATAPLKGKKHAMPRRSRSGKAGTPAPPMSPPPPPLAFLTGPYLHSVWSTVVRNLPPASVKVLPTVRRFAGMQPKDKRLVDFTKRRVGRFVWVAITENGKVVSNKLRAFVDEAK